MLTNSQKKAIIKKQAWELLLIISLWLWTAMTV